MLLAVVALEVGLAVVVAALADAAMVAAVGEDRGELWALGRASLRVRRNPTLCPK